jgi:hypothetical protein
MGSQRRIALATIYDTCHRPNIRRTRIPSTRSYSHRRRIYPRDESPRARYEVPTYLASGRKPAPSTTPATAHSRVDRHRRLGWQRSHFSLDQPARWRSINEKSESVAIIITFDGALHLQASTHHRRCAFSCLLSRGGDTRFTLRRRRAKTIITGSTERRVDRSGAAHIRAHRLCHAGHASRR